MLRYCGCHLDISARKVEKDFQSLTTKTKIDFLISFLKGLINKQISWQADEHDFQKLIAKILINLTTIYADADVSRRFKR